MSNKHKNTPIPEADQEHDHPHDQSLRALSRRLLLWALFINLVFLVVEVIGGIITNSLALLADAGHMLTDVAALTLALVVSYLASRPATAEKTYGLLRAEVLGAFVNGASLVLIVGLILREAWLRIGSSPEINAPVMLGVAFLGLVANLVSAVILNRGDKENVNMRGAFLHMVADALGSVGAIVAGAVIWATGWTLIDPIASVVISILILWSGWGLLKRTINILLEATPENIDYHEVKESLECLDNVESVHDLHIWTISSGVPVLSAHVSLPPRCFNSDEWQKCLESARKLLEDKFGIKHSTIQVEPPKGESAKQCRLLEDDHDH